MIHRSTNSHYSIYFSRLLYLLLLCVTVVLSCKKDVGQPTPTPATNLITANPSIIGISGASVSISGSIYTLTVPAGTNVKALKVNIPVASGTKIDPEPTIARDYTNPVSYTITAADGIQQSISIKVVIDQGTKSTEKQIITFSLAALNPVVQATIDQTTRKITAAVPAGSDLTRLAPTLTLSAKASVSPASGVAQNFTSPVNYTVTAEDGSKQVYEVIVSNSKIADANTNIIFYGGYAFDADTGEKLWYNDLGRDSSPYYSPVIVDETVYTKNFSSFCALNLYTGEKKWEFQLPGLNNLSSISSPINIDNLILFSANISSSGKQLGRIVYALDRTTGEKKWEFLYETMVLYGNELVVNNNVLYVGMGDKIFALDATTGNKRWELKMPSFVQYSSKEIEAGYMASNPSIYNNNLFFLHPAGGINTLDLTKSPPPIDQAIKEGNKQGTGSLFIMNSSICYTSASSLFIVNLDNYSSREYKYESQDNTSTISNPSFSNGMLFSKDGREKLIAIDANSLTKKWTFQVRYGKMVNPVAANGFVYIGDETGGSGNTSKLYAVDSNNGQIKWEQTLNASTAAIPVIRTKDGKIYYSVVSGMLQ